MNKGIYVMCITHISNPLEDSWTPALPNYHICYEIKLQAGMFLSSSWIHLHNPRWRTPSHNLQKKLNGDGCKAPDKFYCIKSSLATYKEALTNLEKIEQGLNITERSLDWREKRDPVQTSPPATRSAEELDVGLLPRRRGLTTWRWDVEMPTDNSPAALERMSFSLKVQCEGGAGRRIATKE
jgi:hypothetical protein